MAYKLTDAGRNVETMIEFCKENGLHVYTEYSPINMSYNFLIASDMDYMPGFIGDTMEFNCTYEQMLSLDEVLEKIKSHFNLKGENK